VWSLHQSKSSIAKWHLHFEMSSHFELTLSQRWWYLRCQTFWLTLSQRWWYFEMSRQFWVAAAAAVVVPSTVRAERKAAVEVEAEAEADRVVEVETAL